ncbi:hypothetical protein PQX77_007615 [Marasmius sp. AFHP31]|nr:hypothetical protein PQX77_007615 [Marasmius sp. AFHP31]
MDLDVLKGLKLTDEKNKHDSRVDVHAATSSETLKHENLFDKLSNTFSGDKAPPPVAVAAPPPEPEHGILDRISHAIGGHSDTPPPAVQPVAADPKHEGFLTKASHLLGGETEVVSAPPPPPPEPKHEHLLDKITGALGGREEAQPPPPPPPEHKNIFEKIGDAFGGEKPVQPPPPPPKPEGLSDKIHAALHGDERKAVSEQQAAGEGILDKLGLGHQPEPVPPKEESLLDRIGSSFHHEPPREPTLGEKIGSSLGLGKTEQQEGTPPACHSRAADPSSYAPCVPLRTHKIISIREHVLRQGQQDNESHFEQWKDDRIAGTIRSQYEKAIGHEFPGKEKK